MIRSFSLLSLLIFPLLSHSAFSRGFTPEDLARLQWVGEVAITPDGQQVAYTRYVPRDPFADDNGSMYEELHVVSAEGVGRAFITGKVNIGAIAWTPDGKKISFLTKRDEDKAKSLYVIPADGGEARKVLAFEHSISEYSWSPDGNTIAFVAREKSDSEQTKLKKLGFNMEVFEEEYRQNRLWLYDTSDSIGQPHLVEFEGNVSTIAFSPSGDLISMTVAPTSLVDDRYTSRKIVIYDVTEKAVVQRIDTPGKLGAIAWSPDSKHLALVTALDRHDPKEGLLAIQTIGRDEPYEVITNDDDGHVGSIAWLNDDELVFSALVGVRTPIVRISREGGPRTVLFEGQSPVAVRMSLSRESRTLALRASTPDFPDEVYLLPLDNPQPKRLTFGNPWLSEVELGRQEVVTYQARDGVEIQGLLIYPVGYEQGQRYPLLEVVHGGPESRMANDWLTGYSYPGQMAAARGYLVFYPNYRGSLGRGIAFSKMGQRDYAGAEFNDLVDAIPYLHDRGLIDSSKVAITGRSYGGFASNWAATALTAHYKAAIAICGASDQTSKFATTDIPEEMYLVHAMLRPWDDWQWYLERSPIYYAGQSRTPLLMIHGETDPRVPTSQSIELYRHLKLHGKAPVRLVLYPGEPHSTRKAAGRYDISKRTLQWIDYYIKGPGEGLPPTQPDYSVWHDSTTGQN